MPRGEANTPVTTVPMAVKVEPPPSSPSFSSLPHGILLKCLARVSKSQYRSLSLVSKTFLHLLSSPELYPLRSQLGNTEPYLYLCLKSHESHLWFTLEQTVITKDGEIKDELSLAPIKIPSSNAPTTAKNSPTVAVGSEIYQIRKGSSGAVRVFDCRSHTWRRAPNTLAPRKLIKCVSLDGKIYVIGTRRKVQWGEVFDVKNQTWKQLPYPTDRLKYESYKVVVFGGRLYVITMNHSYAYDPKEESWTKTEEWLGLSFDSAQQILSGPTCVIENLLFYDGYGRYICYDMSSQRKFLVRGLEDLYMKRANDYYTMQLVNFGGKLVIIWYETTKHDQGKSLWCAVIKLEKHESEIWGEIERFNALVLSVPKSYKRLSCLSVSL